MRVVATGAFLLSMVGMIVCHLAQERLSFLAWPGAFFEAATVGALADWFAVVALFRHPLGIPIWHTAILPNNKERVAESLATFLEDGFLTEEQLGPRVRQIDFAGLASSWLETNADTMASRFVSFAPNLLDQINRSEIAVILAQCARNVIRTTDFSPMLANGIRLVTENGRDREIFRQIISELSNFFSKNEKLLQDKIGEEIPISPDLFGPFFGKLAGPVLSQLRDSISKEVASRTVHKIQTALTESLSDHDHPLWTTFHQRLAVFISDLESSTECRKKIQTMQIALAESQLVDDLSSHAWEAVSEFLHKDLAASESLIRRKLFDGIRSFAQELKSNVPLRDGTNTFLCKQVVASVLSAKPHIRDVVTGTIGSWNAEEMSDKLEATVGADLQFIRLNGTLVGGLVGLSIHALFVLLGK